jgi:hypothetical protein
MPGTIGCAGELDDPEWQVRPLTMLRKQHSIGETFKNVLPCANVQFNNNNAHNVWLQAAEAYGLGFRHGACVLIPSQPFSAFSRC